MLTLNQTQVKVKNVGLVRYTLNTCDKCQEILEMHYPLNLLVDHENKEFNCQHIDERFKKKDYEEIKVNIQFNKRVLPINLNLRELKEREKIKLFIHDLTCICFYEW